MGVVMSDASFRRPEGWRTMTEEQIQWVLAAMKFAWQCGAESTAQRVRSVLTAESTVRGHGHLHVGGGDLQVYLSEVIRAHGPFPEATRDTGGE